MNLSIIEGHTKMMIMNYPHNPTGALLSLSEQAQIIAILIIIIGLVSIFYLKNKKHESV